MVKNTLEYRIDIRFFRLLEKIAIWYRRKCFEKRARKETQQWNALFYSTEKISWKLTDLVKINLYNDSVLSRYIYEGFEEDETIFVQRYLSSGDTFFDIGANVGLFSLLAAPIVGEQGKIYAFEPTPKTFDRLCENIDLNSFKAIKPIQVGLSDSKGKLSFNISTTGFDAWNSFAKLENLKGGQTIDVQTTSLDDFIADNAIETSEIKLIKIDVEGWELNVLKGAKNLLQSIEAPVLMLEFTESNAFSAGCYCGEIYDFVEDFGYKWYRYNSLNNELVYEQKKLHYPYDNLFAIKNIEEVRLAIKI
ncbi:methyltransferase [Bacteroidales bacterium]|nr:methyltransferase [Bacteroidales bacterium]